MKPHFPSSQRCFGPLARGCQESSLPRDLRAMEDPHAALPPTSCAEVTGEAPPMTPDLRSDQRGSLQPAFSRADFLPHRSQLLAAPGFQMSCRCPYLWRAFSFCAFVALLLTRSATGQSTPQPSPLPVLRMPNLAVGTRCFGLLPCTPIDRFGLRLRAAALVAFRPERAHERDLYAAAFSSRRPSR